MTEPLCRTDKQEERRVKCAVTSAVVKLFLSTHSTHIHAQTALLLLLTFNLDHWRQFLLEIINTDRSTNQLHDLECARMTRTAAKTRKRQNRLMMMTMMMITLTRVIQMWCTLMKRKSHNLCYTELYYLNLQICQFLLFCMLLQCGVGLESVSMLIKKDRSWWCGHVRRKDDADQVKQCITMETDETRQN